MLFTEDIWKEFADKIIGGGNKLKTYKQFDHLFDFVKSGYQIRDLVKDPTLKKVATHSFVPHLKILTKTPRYKFDNDIDAYDLETKIRPISFASHFDSYIYSFYAFALTKKYQEFINYHHFNPCILAYRSDLNGDCNIQFAKRAFDAVKDMVEQYGKCHAIALDITGYFDNIDHVLLKEKWSKIIGLPQLPVDQYRVYKSLSQYSYISKASLLKHFKVNLAKHGSWNTLLDLIPDSINGASYHDKFQLIRNRKLIVKNKPKVDKDGNVSNRGIPQGSPMSSVLSNIYLIDFDKWLYELSQKQGFHYFRYCDDLLIVYKAEDTSGLNESIVKEIKGNYKLTIQEKKTELIEFRSNSKGVIRSFDLKAPTKTSHSKIDEQKHYKNLQYLGFEFNGENIYIKPGSLSRYFRKANGRVLKTVMMAYGKRSKKEKISRKQLYFKYSHFGARNFITYAQNAAKKEYTNSAGILREGLDSLSIKRQLSAHFSIIERTLNIKSHQFASSKSKKPKM